MCNKQCDTTNNGLTNKQANFGAVCTVKSYPEILSEIIGGSYNVSTDYAPYIDLEFKVNSQETQSIVVNSSFYDCRKKFTGFFAEQKFVLLYKQCGAEIIENEKTAYESKLPFEVAIGEQVFDTTKGAYDFTFTSNPFIVFDSTLSLDYENANHTEYNGYKYIISSVRSDYALTEKDYSHLKV